MSRTAGARIDTPRKIIYRDGIPHDVHAAVDAVYRSDRGRIVATLIRLVGDFDVAEEAAQEACAAAVTQWPADGVPDLPRAWIIRTARHKAIDRLRRQRRFADTVDAHAATEVPLAVEPPDYDPDEIPDDRLRLIFTCCHPSLAPEAQVALTLRTLGGLETDQIARAFLVPVATMAQRLVRAKAKIRAAGIPYIFTARADRRARRRSRRLPSAARRACRPAAAPRIAGRRGDELRPRARARHQRRGAPLSRSAPPRGAAPHDVLNAPSASSRISAFTPVLSVGPPPGTAAE